jgi:hypothetical protein
MINIIGWIQLELSEMSEQIQVVFAFKWKDAPIR